MQRNRNEQMRRCSGELRKERKLKQSSQRERTSEIEIEREREQFELRRTRWMKLPQIKRKQISTAWHTFTKMVWFKIEWDDNGIEILCSHMAWTRRSSTNDNNNNSTLTLLRPIESQWMRIQTSLKSRRLSTVARRDAAINTKSSRICLSTIVNKLNMMVVHLF